MTISIVRRVAVKELRETLRDRRTLLMMVVLPIFLYPVLFVLMEQMTLFGQRKLEERPAAVRMVGGSREAARFLAADSAIDLETRGPAGAAEVAAGSIDAVLVFADAPAPGGTAEARVVYDASRERSRYAREAVERRLERWGDTLLARRIERAGLPAGFAEPLQLTDSSVATAERVGGYALGRFLPLILILMTILGAFYPAIDLAAGEKERGTLEPLLTVPVPARDLLAGKFVAVSVIGFAAAALNLGSMLLTFQSGVFRFSQAAGISFSLPPRSIVVVLAVLVPLSVLFAALFLGIAARAHSFKEAQTALTPVYLVSFLPAMLSMMPGIEFTPALAVVPVAGVAFLFRSLLEGDAPVLASLLALASTVLYAGIALALAARTFGSERVLFGSGGGTVARGSLVARLRGWRASDRRTPLAAEALGLVALCGLLYFYLGSAMQLRLGERGLLASQWLLLGLPALALAFAGPYDARRTLALRVPSGRGVASAVLIIAGGVPLGWAIAWMQSFFLPLPEELFGALERLLTAPDAARLAWLLLIVALTPAICEELVFRGVLLQGLGREQSMVRAVVGSAVIFGAFHLSFETAVRFLPTVWLGLLIGTVVWKTRSLLAGMLMHFLNNALAVAIVSTPALRSRLVDESGSPAWGVVAVAPFLLLAGVALLPRRRGETDVDTGGAGP